MIITLYARKVWQYHDAALYLNSSQFEPIFTIITLYSALFFRKCLIFALRLLEKSDFHLTNTKLNTQCHLAIETGQT